VFTLLIGIVSGTYSSIFNASPLLVEWERRPDRLMYALSFALPPVGLAVGLFLLFRGDRRSKSWGRSALVAAAVGAVCLVGLFLLRGFLSG
jgi:hypothetical protein